MNRRWMIPVLVISGMMVLFYSVRYVRLNRADQYRRQGIYESAYDIYKYWSRKEAASLRETHPLLEASKGSVILFGRYEQDNNTENGKEPIEWRVLTKENNKALLISEKILDCSCLYKSKADAGMVISELRKWQCNDFYYKAFSEQERGLIRRYQSSGAPYNMNIWEDPVFMLDSVRMEEIYGISYNSIADLRAKHKSLSISPTEYVKQNYPKNQGRWWIGNRHSQDTELLIKGDGSLGSSDCTDTEVGIRPLIWLEQ